MQAVHLDNLNEKTYQEVFDFVVEKLFEQGEPSHLDGACMYRSYNDDGKKLKCAAGQLMTDEQYIQLDDPEGKPWITIANNIGIVNHIDLIGDLQYVHDFDVDRDSADEDSVVPPSREYIIENWKRRFRDRAKKYDLNTNVLDKLSPKTQQ